MGSVALSLDRSVLTAGTRIVKRLVKSDFHFYITLIQSVVKQTFEQFEDLFNLFYFVKNFICTKKTKNFLYGTLFNVFDV